jgi:hypothetical protein
MINTQADSAAALGTSLDRTPPRGDSAPRTVSCDTPHLPPTREHVMTLRVYHVRPDGSRYGDGAGEGI